MISVIIPTYNRVQMLKKAVSSVFAQKYSDFELIIVDDCSVEDNLSMLEAEFAEHLDCNKIRYYKLEKNMQKSFCRNYGVEHAKGQYVAFLDDDDYYLENHLSNMMESVSKCPEAGAYFSNATVYRGSEVFPVHDGIKSGSGKRVRDLCIKGTIGSSCYMLVKKECFLELGGFDESLDVYEDRAFIAKLAINNEIFYSEKATIGIYTHPGSYSYQRGLEGMADVKFKVLEDILQEANERNYKLSNRLFAHMYLNILYSYGSKNRKSFSVITSALHRRKSVLLDFLFLWQVLVCWLRVFLSFVAKLLKYIPIKVYYSLCVLRNNYNERRLLFRLENELRLKDKISFIQIGSNDGAQGDPLHDFIVDDSRWTGVLVEPVKFCFDRLTKNYSKQKDRLTFENVAISEQQGTRKFYYVSSDAKKEIKDLPFWYDQLGSFDKDHIQKHLGDSVEKFIVARDLECCSVDDLLVKNKIESLDLIHIDTEGYDFKVLSLFDVSVYKPQIILFEYKHLPRVDRKAAIARLRSEGYKIYICQQDILAVNKRVV